MSDDLAALKRSAERLQSASTIDEFREEYVGLGVQLKRFGHVVSREAAERHRKYEAERRVRTRSVLPALESEVLELRKRLCVLAEDGEHAVPRGMPVRKEVPDEVQGVRRIYDMRRNREDYKQALTRWLTTEKERLSNAIAGITALSRETSLSYFPQHTLEPPSL